MGVGETEIAGMAVGGEVGVAGTGVVVGAMSPAVTMGCPWPTNGMKISSDVAGVDRADWSSGVVVFVDTGSVAGEAGRGG